jgi:hypothetical protein
LTSHELKHMKPLTTETAMNATLGTGPHH